MDLQLINPITGKWMTGSSSGTALNVFYGINDAGIGTDGGGSVLAPAAALNLYGFISPLIEQDHMRQHSKASTDGILFSPSIGAITRDLKTLEQVLDPLLGISLTEDSDDKNAGWEWKEVPNDGQPDIYGGREPLIQYLNGIIRPGTILISREGPVDVNAWETAFTAILIRKQKNARLVQEKADAGGQYVRKIRTDRSFH